MASHYLSSIWTDFASFRPDEEASQQIEDWIKNRAKSVLNIIDCGNPIAKIPSFVLGNDGNLAINETGTNEEGGVTNNVNEFTFIMT